MNMNDDEAIGLLNRLLERLHQADLTNFGSHLQIVYVASGAQHVENIQTQYVGTNPKPTPSPSQGQTTPIPSQRGGEPRLPEVLATERISHCIALLMQEKYGNEALFNKQSHWQAVYRILVDKEYCCDSDFDGFDAFIRAVMPEKVNKPYTKASVKQISQTDFVKPFKKWMFDHQTSKTRKPFDRMVTVAQRFLEIMGENGL